jgi:iron(II)-dependent oxidoreductase
MVRCGTIRACDTSQLPEPVGPVTNLFDHGPLAMTDTTALPRADVKAALVAELEAARRRTLALLEPLSDDDLTCQHSPLQSPLVWDLAHIGVFEELWLLQRVGGAPPMVPEYAGLYDAFNHPRIERAELGLMGPARSRSYVAEVRERALGVLERTDLDETDRLLADGFVFWMIVQHEHQHCETMLATLQLRDGEYPLPPVELPPPRALPAREVFVEGGPFVLGAVDEPSAYDNERPAHEVDLAPFWIDAVPVTNREYAAFVDSGGYDDSRLWSSEGWSCLQDEGLERPRFWRREGDGACSRVRFGHVEALPPDEPVQHVCWFEADAYARWAGKRLPTEAEWEKAASWDGAKRRFPWGDRRPTAFEANLAEPDRFRPAPAGGYPAGASAAGCEQLIGDVWEWTASDFRGYPSFEAFPYREYSEVFFGGEYKVLRGGSWAVHPTAIRASFRNWDYPSRRQIFAGFRCARDA